MLYAFFWVIPRRLNFIFRRFGTLFVPYYFPSQTFSRIIPQTCPQPSSFFTHLPAYEDGTECSETSEYKIQTAGNHPKESIQLVHKNLPFLCFYVPSSLVFLNRRAAARYRAAASIIPGRERFSWNLSFFMNKYFIVEIF